MSQFDTVDMIVHYRFLHIGMCDVDFLLRSLWVLLLVVRPWKGKKKYIMIIRAGQGSELILVAPCPFILENMSKNYNKLKAINVEAEENKTNNF